MGRNGTVGSMEIRHLPPEDVTLYGEIDRSEHVTTGYEIVDGTLIAREVDWTVPPWDPDATTGEHTVHHMVEFTRDVVARGALLLGAFDGDDLMGLAVVEPRFEPGLAWLATLHVSDRYRRRGAAGALWEEAVRLCREAGAPRMYVSSTPSESAVGFYLSKSCVLADPPHRDLLALEPDDIHLTLTL
jgi:predicted N-acetyltransferase YhbS